MFFPRLFAVVALAASGVLSGCAPVATYNPAYISHAKFAEAEKLNGRILIYTEKTDDDVPYMGKPTSFTGSGTTLTIPLGMITREIAVIVFGDLFLGGAERSNSLTNLTSYRLVLKPKIINFSYEYNQLKNLGFAITPTVIATLDVSLLDGKGTASWTRSYFSGTVETDAYIVSGAPGEEIGKAAHKAIYDLMLKAVKDIRLEVGTGNIPEVKEL